MSDFDAFHSSLREFITERDWSRFHDPKSLVLALVGEVGELSELFQWLPAQEAAAQAHEEPLRTRVGEELADVLTFLVCLGDAVGIDLVAAAAHKLKNSRRRFPATDIYGVAPVKE
jgi:dCTP diphosphatase